MKGRQWWRSEAPGARLRRRLLACSAPIAIVLLLTLVKLCSVAIAGNSAASDFAERDADALRGDVAALNVVNVVEAEKAYLAAGTLAVLGDRLDDADMQFSAALARTDPARSCPARINLELVRETLGDRAARALDTNSAVTRYRSALADVEQAPRGCFTGSTDSDEKRRALLDNAATRLSGKIDAARVAPLARHQLQVSRPRRPRRRPWRRRATSRTDSSVPNRKPVRLNAVYQYTFAAGVSQRAGPPPRRPRLR